MRGLICPLILACFFAAMAPAVEIQLPAEAVLIDVTKAPYNAVGNGIADDTAAIQAAVTAALQSNRNYFTTPPLIYLPRGIYRLTDTINGRIGTGLSDWHNGMILMGESRTGTVLRLNANAAGFGDAANRKPLLRPASDHSDGSGPVESSTDGHGNRAFRNAVINLTVEIGAGNAGCVAIDFLASNRGCIEDVTIRDLGNSAATGIGMDRNWPGPALIDRVRIEGFAYALTMRNQYEYGMTVEDLEIVEPRTAAILVENNALNLRHVTYTGRVPFLLADASGSGGVVLLDSTLNASGTVTGAAIRTAKRLYVQNLSSTGWPTVIDDLTGANQDLAGTSAGTGGSTNVAFYTTGGTHAMNGEAIAPLGLPVADTPDVPWPTRDQWTVVQSYQSINNAITAGKPGVLLTARTNTYNGSHFLTAPIVIPVATTVQRIMGTMVTFQRDTGFPADLPTLRFQGGEGVTVILEHLNIQGIIEHSGAGTLILRHCDFGGLHTGAAGRTFLVDCIGSDMQINAGHRLWARQLNSEYNPDPLNVNRGTAWILGYKTEGEVTNWSNLGGKLALLGAYPRPSVPAPLDKPLFINQNGNLDVSYTMGYQDNSQAPWTLQCREIDGATTIDALRSQIGNGGQALLVSRTGSFTADTTAPATPAPPTAEIGTYARPILSGTTEAYAQIRVFDGATVIGTLTAASDGTWHWQPSVGLAVGAHPLSVQVLDAAGNVSARSGPVTVTVSADTTPPATPAAPSANTADAARPILSGSTEAGAQVRVYDGDTLVGTVTAAADGSWSWQPSAALTAGSHAFSVQAVDAGGNASVRSGSTTVTVPAGLSPSVTPPAQQSSGGGGCGLGSMFGAVALLALSALRLRLRRR